ncbi:MAG: secretion system protein E [Gammaproteobacteria bacterium]|nr:secretion system protein E [Gammaproteobacteria bacterium]NIR81895.1 secretion system protein E [Gammaproteobacteria bacterium]NIR88727.1 secretion system protein E [Gammaproteobacteria bacterium]NIU03003.1 secretion system protein E [Gammaproteobacteria bacterium]NIV50524.1 secretion system protein E [Gammaproteobacteria bacterium]
MDIAARPARIGELLVAKGVVSEDQIRIALTEQHKSKNEHLGKILVRLGFATEAVIRDILGGALGYDSVDLSKVVIDGEVVKLIPKDVARRYRLLAITFDRDSNSLILAMTDPFNVIALDQVRALLGGDVEVKALLAGEAELVKAIDQFYGYELSVDGILQEIETGEIDYQSLEAESDEYSQPIVRLVNALLSDAVKRGASDIHFEPEHEFLRIRYRIDGVLRQIRSLHRNYWSAIAVRLKVMAGMNIAEMRAPQDGRMALSVSGRPVDFRVAALPTTYGENIVLRILDRQKGIMPLEHLGLPEGALATLRLMMARPEGIILVTGPTGSGKTTTLYSMLNHLNSESVNIMTLEDPVEYPIEMIRQTSVNEAVRLNFATGIRSMMRQDPDIILVGEIRDADTAEMAFRAAMTGHQVYTTLHTNSSLGAIPRLFDTGIQPDIMVGNIIGVIGQRLVRKLCVHCKEPYEPSKTERKLLALDSDSKAPPIYKDVGCVSCEHRGYKGRLAIMELLKFDLDIDELVARRATLRELTEGAFAKGFTPLAEAGIRRVIEGVTSLDEVSRVVNLTDRFG